MSDNPQPEPAPPAEAGDPTTDTNVSGRVNLDAQHDVNIGGDVVGRDKVTEIEQSVDTGGGAYVDGNIAVEGQGKFTGRDDNSINVSDSPGAIVAHEVTVIQQGKQAHVGRRFWAAMAIIAAIGVVKTDLQPVIT
jgi:hypothetical protein